jgi:hypothetical protein
LWAIAEQVRGNGPRILPGDGSKPVDTNPIARGNSLLDSYANSNPLPTDSSAGSQSQGGDYLDAPDYDIRALNGPRRFTNGNPTHWITPDRNGTLILHVGKMSGNVADKVTIAAVGQSQLIPTTDQVLSYAVSAGVRYPISVSATAAFVLEIRAELA